MDFGFHPPTIYFPLVVPEALMVEPTETEAKETLDAFAEAMLQIVRRGAETIRRRSALRRTAGPSAAWTRCAPRRRRSSGTRSSSASVRLRAAT